MRNIREESKAQLLTLCENVKFLRKREGLSQKEMARRINISVRSLSMLEKGIVPNRLSCEFLFNIYFEFGVKPTDLLRNELD